jgi:hypothetical protein
VSQQSTSNEEYEKAILWVPDPSSPAGWIRRKVWAAEDESKRRHKPPLGFPMPRREG